MMQHFAEEVQEQVRLGKSEQIVAGLLVNGVNVHVIEFYVYHHPTGPINLVVGFCVVFVFEASTFPLFQNQPVQKIVL